jgi:hypothetical protein
VSFPDTAAVAAAATATAAAPTFTLPAAFIAPAIFANAATPPTRAAHRATMGLISMVFFLKELIHKLGISAQLNAVIQRNGMITQSVTLLFNVSQVKEQK